MELGNLAVAPTLYEHCVGRHPVTEFARGGDFNVSVLVLGSQAVVTDQPFSVTSQSSQLIDIQPAIRRWSFA